MVGGEVDRAVITRFRVALHAGLVRAQAGRMLVDLSGTALLDVAGAAVLRDLGVAAALSGTSVVVAGIQPWVATMLVAIGLPTPTGDRLLLGHRAAQDHRALPSAGSFSPGGI